MDDPLEGTNVTLICRQQFMPKTINTKMEWLVIKKEFKEPVPLNETDLPEGLKEITYRRETL